MNTNPFGLPEQISDSRDVRSFVVDWLRRELVGPSPGHPMLQWSAQHPELNGEEILRPQDPPRYRYGAGILFPRGVTYSGSLDPGDSLSDLDASAAEEPDAASLDEVGGEHTTQPNEDASELDEEVEVSTSFLPSTMGISFLLEAADDLEVELEWATYDPRKLRGYGLPGRPRDEEQTLWFRRPQRQIVPLKAEQLIETAQQRLTLVDTPGQGQLVLHVLSRPWSGAPARRLVTLTLMNTSDAEPRNEACFFQCGFTARAVGDARILPYSERPEEQSDDEELSLRLLYRHRPVFAVGHGCAADWDADPSAHFAHSVRTETLPMYEQAPIAPRDYIEGVDLSMRRLGEAEKADVLRSCRSLAQSYGAWIAKRREELAADATISAALKKTGERHLAACDQCHERMLGGIELLERDADALEAFQLMNRAMVEQRAHYALSSEAQLRRQWTEVRGGNVPERPYSQPDYPYSTAWRPFQLAFVLMNLLPFLEPESSERSIVDVIWFPTGGGKTEAYLGLAAFCILHRRLADPANTGTTVLMRYTLRLLTTQQFQRAASLICALELMRRGSPQTFGETPITIGLWLGSGVTPNRNKEAVADLAKLAQGQGDNRFIVLSCPWCGVDMGPQPLGRKTRVFGYEQTGSPAHVRFRCEDHDCPFSSEIGLPLEVVDERIYSSPPTMLIGTVDKFAMMPWQPQARHLFGIHSETAVSPPDLVIQDELHLIAGPLGSMVGHYETVIDELCARSAQGRRIGPKIVASTATIARATEQVKALYDREALLFPPQGLRAGESYFAVERTDVPGRLYVGVLAGALSSHVVAQIRTVAALLQAPALLQEPICPSVPDNLRDPYWTLMCYFNSLRELGRAATLIQADIREYLNAVWDRIGLRADLLGAEGKSLRRFINRDEELTSRLRSAEIPGTLQKLFTGLPSPETVDICLATNMIQVGLDVPRLSLMTIVGQPKTASEYIQASSRVGRDRDKPGLVVTNYNPFKPRDRSHFESFRSYHENVYRHVEPTSVTPFAVPVSERAIHAIAVTLARFKVPELLDSPAAGISTSTRKMITDVIRKRVRSISEGDEDIALEKLEDFLDLWDRWRPENYGDFIGSSESEPLLWPAGKAPADEDWLSTSPTMASMRSVDAESEAMLIRQYVTGSDR
ncbi:helicase-related protein [Tsuneonella sp. SYSU-LHT278]|uniref:helicase-related protein n=1 Tax=Tsuneonella sediminis TaxID=3416089 RepID=UPI003F7961F2